MKKYIMVITYSWDTAYVAVPCNTYEDAVETLNSYLKEEIETIKEECEYEPIVWERTVDLKELVYEESDLYIDSKTDVAEYRVIEVSNL